MNTRINSLTEGTISTADWFPIDGPNGTKKLSTGLIAASIENAAAEYDSAETYNEGDYCTHDGTFYVCNDDAVTGTWDSTKWDETNAAEELSTLKEDKADIWRAGRPRYKDITSYFTDGTLWNRISGTGYDCSYYDIMPGDYFDMGTPVSAPNQDPSYATTGSQWVTVVSCGGLMHNGDQGDGVNYEHLVIVPGKGKDGLYHFGRKRMNSSHTTEGGYAGSEMHTTTIGAVTSSGSSSGTINQQLYAIFGSHLKTTRELLTNSINASGYNRFGTNSGCSNDWRWVSCQACLMSEMEVYGGAICSSSLYDTGVSKRQFELFAMDEKTINNRSSYYWLKDIVSASRFASVDHDGLAYYYSAGDANYYVRPRFVIA